MVKVNFVSEDKKRGIEVGDVIHLIDDEMFLQVVNVDDEKLGLFNIETSTIGRTDFNHMAHVINYIKKEYGEFTVIESSRISINIQ
jgi:hypothetical protein